MTIVQCILLHVALSNRVLSNPVRDLANPFAGSRDGSTIAASRPYNFWQWRSPRSYWTFIVYMTLTLFVLQMLVGSSSFYVNTIGYCALAIEATLPLPQILANHRRRSCQGFRLSVLINWLLGDVLKMSFFFLSESSVPWAFKLCGLFQFGCDMFLGIQYMQFGEGQSESIELT